MMGYNNKYTKTHGSVHFKQVNCVVWELILKKLLNSKNKLANRNRKGRMSPKKKKSPLNKDKIENHGIIIYHLN